MNSEQTDLPVLPEREAQASRLSRWRSRVEYQGLSLGLVCALVALALLLGDHFTRDAIASRQQEDQLATLSQVLPARLYDNDPLAEAFRLQDAELGEVEVYPARRGGELVAVTLRVGTLGYGGPIVQLIALDNQGRILGVRVLSHKETPGLADKIEPAKSDWIMRFADLSLGNPSLEQWKVKKDGGQFDQFAGATITPRAVVKGILRALQLHARHAGGLAGQPEEVQP